MITLASGLSYIDLLFQDLPRVIATVVVHGPGGVTLVDPGPSSTLPVLRRELERAGIAIADVTSLLLTHIHLDHAGASGTLVRENPRLRVYVHQNGAPHLIDPSRLLASATRLYGDAMDRLWGECRPVPADAIVVLAGGERITASGRELDVAYTPGHASHHVSYFSGDSGIAFVGDTAGIRLMPGGFVLPPTPPPDIDLDAWRDSLSRIDAWGAGTLFLTHFGPSVPVGPHLRELGDHLELTRRLVAESLAQDGTDETREQWFIDEIRRALRRRMTDADAHSYEVAGRNDLNWRGLARYLRKLTPSRGSR
jgi:glyoxylase-like metal-dependent hydrolase (beta-lactamase superfamily II)